MTLNINSLDKDTYLDLRYEIIKQLEESGHENTEIYTDGVGLVTIGVGFNVEVEGVLKAVLEEGFKLDPNALNSFKNGKDFDGLVDALLVELGKPQLAWQKMGHPNLMIRKNNQLDNKVFGCPRLVTNIHSELNGATGNPATTYIEARDNMIKIGNSHAEA